MVDLLKSFGSMDGMDISTDEDGVMLVPFCDLLLTGRELHVVAMDGWDDDATDDGDLSMDDDTFMGVTSIC